ncbi:mRNA capping enzyme [Tubulinosema ratisbonensis]|uniref:mRNA cap guanine-N(7) methyltransferase n=1 Tax=Tubulinosema ratisbonensis TaxID=291195 RepID=A0A437AI15_9MICR|nr:mRNA capping enzyme [Tubulinosema ratisbonensis]
MNNEAEKIKEHYEKSKIYSTVERKMLATINIRSFNNFIKAILIKKYVNRNDSVLDLGCGKGGDLNKFRTSNIYEYVGIDTSENCIKEAKSRYEKKNNKFKGTFIASDCFNEPIDLKKQFDIISIQFSFHYAFSSQESLNTTLKNISDHLKIGGYVIATIPNSKALKRRYEKYGNNFGNEFYTVEFVKDLKSNTDKLGVEYYFTLKDSLDKCLEYLIYDDFLEKECKKYDLKLIEFKDFISFFNENFKNNSDLYNKMVQTILNDKELDVPRLYSILVLKKE